MTPVRCRFSTRFLPLLLAATTAALGPGCVQRRMTIRSNPPGAQVYVDNHEIGRTPVSTDFIYYGKRNIRLVKDGYETLTIQQPVSPPWYQIPGIDFFAENLTSWEVRDERNFDYQMQPLLVVPSETLLSRAEELRRGNQVIPASPITTAPVTLGLPGQYAPGAYVPPAAGAPPAGVVPPVTPVPTLPPGATTNYPPQQPTPATAPQYSLPGEFGGRPVQQLP